MVAPESGENSKGVLHNFDIGRQGLKGLLYVGGVVVQEGAFVVDEDKHLDVSVGRALQQQVQPLLPVPAEWAHELKLWGDVPARDHELGLRSLDALGDGLEVVFAIDDEVHAVLVLPDSREALEPILRMHQRLVLRQPREVQKFEEVFGVLGIQQQLAVVGLDHDAQLIAGLLLPLDDPEAVAEGQKLLGLFAVG